MDVPSNMNMTIIRTAAGLGVVGLFSAFAGPHADLLAIAPTWSGLLVKLADQSGQHLDKDTALKIASGVLMGVSAFGGGVKLASSAFAYSGVGTLPAVILNGGLNAVLTYLFGRAAAQVFLEEDLSQSVENLIRAILAILGGVLKPQ